MGNESIEAYAYYQDNDDERVSYFITKDGRKYSVSFEEQPFVENKDFILADRTYEVFLTLQKAPPAYSTDSRIGATVTEIIQKFIEQDPLRLIFFTCDTADGRHLARHRRFSDWFREYSDQKYLKLEDCVEYAAINKVFLVILIMHTKHPYKLAVLSAFTEQNDYLRSQK